MFKARVRGIYSTALTKLLIDEGFEIVQPSAVIEERFNFSKREVFKPLDIDIFDRDDRQGVYALCTREAWRHLASSLQKRLLDVIVRKWRPQVGGVYKGLVKHLDRSGEVAFVQIDEEIIGILYPSKPLRNDVKEILVQVERTNFGSKCPVLSDKIKISGKYAILIPEERVKISRRIKDSRVRDYLRNFGLRIKPEGWGIIWRTAAATASEDELKQEINLLLEKWRKLVEMEKEASAPALLLEGLVLLNVEFPHESKRILDEIRSHVTPTIPGHHYYKAFSANLSSSVDMAENLLRRGYSKDDVLNSFEQIVQMNLPCDGDVICIRHVKLSGKEVNLGRAVIEFFDQSSGSIKLRRNIYGQGVYDGLEVEKHPGDYAISFAHIGSWYLKTEYFSKEGEFKGAYININTPIELYPRQIRYVDLEIDVCVLNNGDVFVLDEDKLNRALDQGIISHKLFERVKLEVERVLNEVVPKVLEENLHE
ncbi:MAG: hypothetical protein DRJ26_02685 [Candidatus Methanomethylicota archaeon]|uniref:Probable ribonuclease FAU-1 n=1 Tax=Thermoproteota archaeon TaxID=2056631 RepID=A0A497F4K6_9CREN|nr:MAG: hypothetical protein DRJ26_02685 [Candidatus Verstraetearchaeota archaeon]